MNAPGPHRSVTLFCSAVEALPESARVAAREFGEGCARRRLSLVYGGGSLGLMGAAARACHDAGGEVIGIMPRQLVNRERLGREVGTLEIVETLSQRKQRMADLGGCFVCLPGGVGTLDELIEMITWFDLGVHRKPVLLCNVDGFWDSFVAMMAQWKAYGVLRPHVHAAWQVLPDVPSTLDAVGALLADAEAARP